MIEDSVRRGSTRHHRTDSAFADLLADDFGLSPFAAHALVGVPKKAAIMVCAWAEANIADTDRRSKAVRAWARKRGVGQFHPDLLDAPPVEYTNAEEGRG